MFKMAYQAADNSASTVADKDLSSYTDFGIMVSPEMVEGLTIGYAEGELDDTATTSIDNETFFIKYAIGGFTFGYQESEAEGSTAAKNDESEGFGVTYAVNENLTIGYGERDHDDDTSAAGEQNDKGFSASYTMGGMTIAGHMNENDNVNSNASAATMDKESYELALTFAF